MAFGKPAVQASTTPGGATPGGRYSAIRPRAAGPDKLKQGEYVLEGVSTALSRKGGTVLIQAKVKKCEGKDATAPSDATKLVMLNFVGNSADAGLARLVQLAMALCNCETVEQMNEEQPHWEDLVDLLCCKIRKSEHYPENPIAGNVFYARGKNSTTLGGDGEPFVNWDFGIAVDDE